MAQQPRQTVSAVTSSAVLTPGELLARVAELYGIDAWGAGYFGINRAGHLTVRPLADRGPAISVRCILDELEKRGVRPPVILRFPQIIATQVERLRAAFDEAIRAFDYRGSHIAVYPMKVNQHRSVVDAYLRASRKYGYGLEAGSKAELYTAIALEQPPGSPLILNGFKDQEFLQLAFLARALGKDVIVVIEKLSELTNYARVAERWSGPRPRLGIRVKLHARGSGRWEESGGEGAKFGLTTTEVLEVVRRCREWGFLRDLNLLHFHIGSQITDIKRIKAAVKEASRVYARLFKTGVPLQLLDVGGGLAVDYDGSRTSFASSANYSLQEYANAIVYQTQVICDDEGIPHPRLITECGRVLAAYHELLITNIQDEIETVVEEVTPFEPHQDDPQVLVELEDLDRNISVKNYVEFFHDAVELREELYTLFDLGQIGLEQRARGEVLFWDICEKAERLARRQKHIPEEFLKLRKLLAARYLANFSVFTSLPDSWAIDQLFPVVPVQRLNEWPGEYATFSDLTCDSDGVVDRFVDVHDVKEILEVHPLSRNERYYIAFALIGAYQDMLGSRHNLFGRVNEAEILSNGDGFIIQRITRGETVGSVIAEAGYDANELHRAVQSRLDQSVDMGLMSEEDAARLLALYSRYASIYTYLDPAEALAELPPCEGDAPSTVLAERAEPSAHDTQRVPESAETPPGTTVEVGQEQGIRGEAL